MCLIFYLFRECHRFELTTHPAQQALYPIQMGLLALPCCPAGRRSISSLLTRQHCQHSVPKCYTSILACATLGTLFSTLAPCPRPGLCRLELAPGPCHRHLSTPINAGSSAVSRATGGGSLRGPLPADLRPVMAHWSPVAGGSLTVPGDRPHPRPGSVCLLAGGHN